MPDPVRTRTMYCQPAWWKHPLCRWYRARKLKKWRNQGFAAYKLRITQKPAAPRNERLKEGIAFCIVKRTRQRMYFQATASLAGFAIDEVIGRRMQ